MKLDISLPLCLFLERSVAYLSSGNHVAALPLRRSGGSIHGGRRYSIGMAASAPFVDLSGKKCIITGGNTGLGFESAVSLANMGADVTIACRDMKKAEEAVSKIVERAALENRRSGKPFGTVDALELDLSSLDSVRDFPSKYSGKLDILINNAGVMAIPTLERTVDGFEKHMGVNHFGHFLLTGLLLDKLLAAEDGRIVNLSSSAHTIPPGKLNPNGDINFNETPYKPWPAYGQSKLANIYFTKELNKRLAKAAGGKQSLTPMAVHPGACRTELGRYIFDPKKMNPIKLALISPLLAVAVLFTKSPFEGAQTQIKCASDPSYGYGTAGGRYYADLEETQTSKYAEDMEAAEWLFQKSEELTGFQYKIK